MSHVKYCVPLPELPEDALDEIEYRPAVAGDYYINLAGRWEICNDLTSYTDVLATPRRRPKGIEFIKNLEPGSRIEYEGQEFYKTSTHLILLRSCRGLLTFWVARGNSDTNIWRFRDDLQDGLRGLLSRLSAANCCIYPPKKNPKKEG